ALPEDERQKRGLKPLEILVISPSQPINDIARHYVDRLPLPLRRALGGGSTEDTSASLASYLLFDPDFCKALIRLGYEDAKAHAKMLDNFITCNEDSV
ncbi:MAG: patatin-like phospholipase family protein, partial [Gammaproteobacteria bacterium]